MPTSHFRKLIFTRMSVEAIPAGTGNPLQKGLEFLTSPRRVAEAYKEAEQWAKAAVRAVKQAPGANPSWTDEDIAKMILDKLGKMLGRKF